MVDDQVAMAGGRPTEATRTGTRGSERPPAEERDEGLRLNNLTPAPWQYNIIYFVLERVLLW